MGDQQTPLLDQQLSRNVQTNEEEFIPSPDNAKGEFLVFKYKEQERKFKYASKAILDDLKLHLTIEQKQELQADIQRLTNTKEYYNLPPFYIRFLTTLLFVLITLTVTTVMVMIWAMLILDLVFLAFTLFIIRKTVIFCWVIRVTFLNRHKGYFSRLNKEIKKLNERNKNLNLEWRLKMPEKWLYLYEPNP